VTIRGDRAAAFGLDPARGANPNFRSFQRSGHCHRMIAAWCAKGRNPKAAAPHLSPRPTAGLGRPQRQLALGKPGPKPHRRSESNVFDATLRMNVGFSVTQHMTNLL